MKQEKTQKRNISESLGVLKIKTIIDEDFTNYKKPSMLIGTCFCNWKCAKERNFDISICQNQSISQQKNIDVPTDEIFCRYISNPITEAIIFAGLEPMLQFDEMLNVINHFRTLKCCDDIVIYTGYYKEEIQDKINILKQYHNIIIKYGRFVPNCKKHFDNVLGVELASPNQFAERIS